MGAVDQALNSLCARTSTQLEQTCCDELPTTIVSFWRRERRNRLTLRVRGVIILHYMLLQEDPLACLSRISQTCSLHRNMVNVRH